MIKDELGNLVGGKKQVTERWAEYFECLLQNEELVRETDDEVETEEEELEIEVVMEMSEAATVPPREQEVEMAIKELKNRKAPGFDGIPAELYKEGRKQLIPVLHELMCKIWDSESMPDDWCKSIICPIYKKGDKLNCVNYRGISLLCNGYKIFTNILRKRIEPFAERLLGQYQAGFRRGRSTVDQLFSVRQIQEKCWEFGINMYQIFVDYRQAYDSIYREKVTQILTSLGIPRKLVSLVKVTLSNTSACVKIQNDLSSPFKVTRGLKQGDGLAPLLFNLILEYAIRRAKIQTEGTIQQKMTQLIGYADDINIVSRRKGEAVETLDKLDRQGRKVGLQVSDKKTKIMMQVRGEDPAGSVCINQLEIERVDRFRYLGAIVTEDNKEGIEIQNRLQAANKTYYALTPLLRCRDVSRNTKLTIYKTLIRPVLVYGCEAWTLAKNQAKNLDLFERKILRRIIGPVKEEGRWRIRYNKELYKLYKDVPISNWVRLKRLEWAGHVVRMEEPRVPRKLLNS